MSFLLQQLVANGGSGSPSTLGRIVASKAIFDFITNDSIASVTYGSAGTGYIVGETFDIVVAGSPGVEVFTATGVVVAESGGVPSEVKIISGGAFVNAKQSPEIQSTGLATANSGAGGDNGLLVDVVFEESHWTQDRGFGIESPVAATDYSDDNTDFEWICSSLKTTNPATIGLKSDQDSGNGFVNLLVATGFDKTAIWTGQPGGSPTAVLTGLLNPRLMMPSTDPLIYISSTERRVNIMIRDGNFVQYGTIGMFIPFTDTEANYPFPGACFGETTGALPFNTTYVESSGNPEAGLAGVVWPMAIQASQIDETPYYFRDNVSPQWLNISADTEENTSKHAQIWPKANEDAMHSFNNAPEVDGFQTEPLAAPVSISGGILAEENAASGGWFATDRFAARAFAGVAPLGLGNRLSFVAQPHIIKSQTLDNQVLGILDGYEAVHGQGLTAFEEIVQFNGKRYIAFPDTNTGEQSNWVAMEIS